MGGRKGESERARGGEGERGREREIEREIERGREGCRREGEGKGLNPDSLIIEKEL